MNNSAIGLLVICFVVFFVVFQMMRVASAMRANKPRSNHFNEMLMVHQARQQVEREKLEKAPQEKVVQGVVLSKSEPARPAMITQAA